MLNQTDDVPEAEEPDAIDMLVADHKRVKHLFARFDALRDEGSDDEKLRIVHEICQELTIHTALEDEIFYPAVRQQIDDDDLMDEALIEHAGAKHLIGQLRSADPSDDLYAAKVTVLGEQIDHHVTEEEGSMFPQARFVAVDTRDLAARMRARKAELMNQADPAPHPDRSGNRKARPEAAELDGSTAILGDATLGDATLGDATLGDATLGDATLCDATLGETTFDDATLGETTAGAAFIANVQPIAGVTPIRAAGAPTKARSVKRPARSTKQAVKKKPVQTARKRS
jgi:hemerythrin superfamily protein